jgi:hypothetical protein
MTHNRSNYWSCSKLADIILGVKKQKSYTSKEWKKWKSEAQTKHPIKFWIAEEGLDILQDIFLFIPDVVNTVFYYIRNRFIRKSHYLRTGLKPGYYYDLSGKILEGLFCGLVDFVEIEKAWLQVSWNCCDIEGTNKEKEKYLNSKYNLSWWRRKIGFRCPQAGLDYLEWEIGLKKESSTQAKVAKEVKELYLWWKNRINRPDSYEASGWDALCDTKRGDDFFDWGEPVKGEHEAFQKLREIEAQYEQEDTDMLIRLIKIREGLRT